MAHIKLLHQNRREGSTGYRLIFFATLAFILCLENKILGSFIPFYGSLKYLRMILVVLLILIRVRMLRISKAFLFLMLFVLSILFATFFNGGAMMSAVMSMSDTLFILLFLEVFAYRNKSKLLLIFDTWKWLMLLLIVADFYSIVRYPNGLYVNEFREIQWFLGYKTQRMMYMLPASFFFSFSSLQKKEKIDLVSFLIVILCIVDLYFCKASSAIGTMVICFLGMLYVNRFVKQPTAGKKKRKTLPSIIDYRVFIPAIILFTFLVTFVRMDRIIALISGSFGKSLTLSNRTAIWETLTSMLIRKPLFGMGFLTSEQYLAIGSYTNAHCTLMTIFVDGGLLAFSLFLLYIYSSFSGIDNTKQALLATLFVYAIFIMGVTSSVYLFSPYCFVPLYCLSFCKSRRRMRKIVLKNRS